jgi:hypothetical protein
MTRDTEFNFTVDFPETYSGSGKYQMLTNNRNTDVNKDQLINVILIIFKSK